MFKILKQFSKPQNTFGKTYSIYKTHNLSFNTAAWSLASFSTGNGKGNYRGAPDGNFQGATIDMYSTENEKEDPVYTADLVEFTDNDIDADGSVHDIDIYSDEFHASLRQFCHEYQTPFLEHNIPKSCRNAAKIYYRM